MLVWRWPQWAVTDELSAFVIFIETIHYGVPVLDSNHFRELVKTRLYLRHSQMKKKKTRIEKRCTFFFWCRSLAVIGWEAAYTLNRPSLHWKADQHRCISMKILFLPNKHGTEPNRGKNRLLTIDWRTLLRDSVVLLGTSVTTWVVINDFKRCDQEKGPPALNHSSVLLSDLCAAYGLSITSIMLEHNMVHTTV